MASISNYILNRYTNVIYQYNEERMIYIEIKNKKLKNKTINLRTYFKNFETYKRLNYYEQALYYQCLLRAEKSTIDETKQKWLDAAEEIFKKYPEYLI